MDGMGGGGGGGANGYPGGGVELLGMGSSGTGGRCGVGDTVTEEDQSGGDGSSNGHSRGGGSYPVDPAPSVYDGTYGAFGGGGTHDANGAVRIIWGLERSFPNNAGWIARTVPSQIDW
jgi:hypothetical protein